jgi:hypothetical protein
LLVADFGPSPGAGVSSFGFGIACDVSVTSNAFVGAAGSAGSSPSPLLCLRAYATVLVREIFDRSGVPLRRMTSVVPAFDDAGKFARTS